LKIKPADTFFSKCIRQKANWTCERCHKHFIKNAQGLHCSHIFSRRHRTIRWCKGNAQALCYTCHQWFGGSPAESGYWITRLMGEGHIQILKEKMNSREKISKMQEKSIAKHYREQLKLLENGEKDFVSWQ